MEWDLPRRRHVPKSLPFMFAGSGEGLQRSRNTIISTSGSKYRLFCSRLHFPPSLPTRGPEFRNRISLKTVTESEFRDSGTESARFLSRIGRCPVGAGHDERVGDDRQEIPGQARNDYEGLGMTTKGPRNDYEIPDQVGDDERCGQVKILRCAQDDRVGEDGQS